MDTIPVIDLFAGPGGLGEGFSSVNGVGKVSPFQVVLSVENEANAINTLRIRETWRALVRQGRTEEYYRWLKSKNPCTETFCQTFPDEFQAAGEAVLGLEIGKRTHRKLDRKIEQVLAGRKDWLLIGGPPCQAYSIMGRVRNESVAGYKPEDDPRYVLYTEYQRIVKKYKPVAFVLENVVGILSARYKNKSVIQQVLKSLEDAGYVLYHLTENEGRLLREYSSPQDFVIEAEKYGVPQARHRVIILGVRKDIHHRPGFLQAASDPVTVLQALADFPCIRSRISHPAELRTQWVEAVQAITQQPWFSQLDSKMQAHMREQLNRLTSTKRAKWDGKCRNIQAKVGCLQWCKSKELSKPVQHDSRSHLQSDLWRYFFAACYAQLHGTSPKLDDFPEGLLPNHKNRATFVDRFRVQTKNRPSTTVTSHISKDGHYYIHPDPTQCRSLSVREAARLQTFPDNYFFSGNRTAQYHQVGNAVPPYLAHQIAEVVMELFRQLSIGGDDA